MPKHALPAAIIASLLVWAIGAASLVRAVKDPPAEKQSLGRPMR